MAAPASPGPPLPRGTVHSQHACRVPDCHNRLYLDVHHVRYRSRGGTHDEDNLLTVCGVHHDLVHDGRLSIERRGDDLVSTFPRGRVVVAPLALAAH